MDYLESSSQIQKDVRMIERRKHPRFRVQLPLDYSLIDGSGNCGGIVANASEGGILVQLPQRFAAGDILKIEIFFLEDLELNRVKAIAKVVWFNLADKTDWAEYQYGLQFESIYKDDLPKYRTLLKRVEKMRN